MTYVDLVERGACKGNVLMTERILYQFFTNERWQKFIEDINQYQPNL